MIPLPFSDLTKCPHWAGRGKEKEGHAGAQLITQWWYRLLQYICYIVLAVPLEEPEKIGGLNPVWPPYKNIEVNEPDVFYSLRSKQNSTTCPVRYGIWVCPEICDSPVILVDHFPH